MNWEATQPGQLGLETNDDEAKKLKMTCILCMFREYD
jgi:hypothetical protein